MIITGVWCVRTRYLMVERTPPPVTPSSRAACSRHLMSSVGQRTSPENSEAPDQAREFSSKLSSSVLSFPSSQATTCWV